MRPVVNLGLLFTELPWAQRFPAAAAAGFDGVEFPWPPLPPEEVVRLARVSRLRVALLNMDAGDLAAGERGYTNDPRQAGRWREQLRRAVQLAVHLDCPLVNVLAGRQLAGLSRADQLGCLTDNLRWAADLARAAGRTLVVEPINDRDVPGYLLPRVDDVLAVLDELDTVTVRLQLDTYHAAVMGDDPPACVMAAGARLGHVQLADFPGRHEPGSGRLDLDALFGALTQVGYVGALGLEYQPTMPSAESLRAVATRHPRLAPQTEVPSPPESGQETAA
ncbi:MAG TPA: TIM barrel protein [Micromonospora sp.]